MPASAIAVHILGAVPALVLGAVQLVRPKGDGWHRRIGALWTGCMAVAIASSFVIYAGSGPSLIHGLSAYTALALVMGVRSIRAGRVRAHRNWMGGACIGLFAAFAFALMPHRLLGQWLWA